MTATMPPIKLPVSVGEVYEARTQGIIDVALAVISAMPLWGWIVVAICVLASGRSAWVMLAKLTFRHARPF